MSHPTLALLNLGGGEIVLILIMLLLLALGAVTVIGLALLASRPSKQKTGAAPSYPTISPTPPPLPPDFDQQLRTLAKLRDEGVITEEEFSAKKKAMLGI